MIHSGRLERYVGALTLEHVSRTMRGWYGLPIPLGGFPGVIVGGDGDFSGQFREGYETSIMDRAHEIVKALVRANRRIAAHNLSQLNAGWASLAEFQSEGRYKQTQYDFAATPNAPTGGGWRSLWYENTVPSPATAAAASAPGGEAPTRSTLGAIQCTDPISGDTRHVIDVRAKLDTTWSTADHAVPYGMSGLLYDRIFQVAKTASSTSTQAVTGVPTRYAATGDDIDSSRNNFVFPEVRTTLGATNHNWTVCQYTNSGGTTGRSFPSIAGIAGNVQNNIDLVLPKFFMPLAAGDVGVKALTQMQNSASVTGAVNFVLAHLLSWFFALPNFMNHLDGTRTAFNLARVYDNAAIALLIFQLNNAANQTTPQIDVRMTTADG
jgi:hypothetical protein